MFFFGIRYGHSNYDEQLRYTLATKEFGTIEKFVQNNNVNSGWLELVTGMRVKIKGAFWMGYTAASNLRHRCMKRTNFNRTTSPATASRSKTVVGFNYYLMEV